MSRRSNQRYICHALEELARQLLYAPPDRRAEDIRRAEALHDELDPAQNYPLEYLAYRITAHRKPEPEGTTLVGEAVLPDLRLMIDSLSRSIELPPSVEESEETTDELSARLGVSGKTVGRWRRAGLRWRWVTPEPGGKKRVVFAASAVAHFQAQHPARAAKASAFKRMTTAERRAAVEQARALSLGDASLTLNQAAKQIAATTCRGLETIRELLQKHDREQPGSALFADHDAPLTESQRGAIERGYLAGDSVGALAERYGRTPSTIYRALHHCRARRARAHTIRYVAEPTFDRDDADEVLLREIAPPGARARRPDAAALSVLPEALRAYYDQPLPPDRLVVALLLRYNYRKHCAAAAQASVAGASTRAADLDAFESLWGHVQRARSACIRAALPLVLSVCRRQETAASDGPSPPLAALLLAAHPVLLALIETHDAAKPARFESVLTHRLLRAFAHPEGEMLMDRTVAEARLEVELRTLGPGPGDA